MPAEKPSYLNFCVPYLVRLSSNTRNSFVLKIIYLKTFMFLSMKFLIIFFTRQAACNTQAMLSHINSELIRFFFYYIKVRRYSVPNGFWGS